MSDTAQSKWGNDWDGLKYVVRIGTKKSAVGKYGYKNANFALFRIIVPILWMKSKNATWDHVNKNSHGFMFMSYVGERIFQPAGVDGASCREWPERRLDAAGYDITKPRQRGALWNIKSSGCGAHGQWHLSMRELATVATLANCANHDKVPAAKRLLSKGACLARNVRRLGWHPNSNGRKQRWKGKYWHSGVLFTPKNPPRKALRSCLMSFPGGIDVAAVVTSDSRDGVNSVCRKVLNAWEAV